MRYFTKKDFQKLSLPEKDVSYMQQYLEEGRN